MRIVSRPQAIPWSAVRAWCEAARLDEDDAEFITSLVAAMDRTYLAWRNERLEADLKRTG